MIDEPGYRSFTETELATLCDQVGARDADLQRVIDTYGYPEFWCRPNTFESLVWFILEQQVSLASARAALDKLRERVGTISPQSVLQLSDDELRAAYFSRQKAGYVRGLAHNLIRGDLDLVALEPLSNEEIRERLVARKGIGDWTADVYLIIVLHRLDLFPAGDIAAVNGLKHLKALPKSTPKAEVVALTQGWSPYRTVGTMLVWHDYLSRRSGTAPR